MEHLLTQTLHFFGLDKSAVSLALSELKHTFPSIAFPLFSDNEILIIHASASAASEQEENTFFSAIDTLIKRFASHYFEAASGKIEEAVDRQFKKTGWTLSIAESCTGGEVASRLVKLPGVSTYFIGSIVCYSDFLKTSLLNVSCATLQTEGAVSKETACAMAEGVAALTNSDISLAITGIAGPTGGSVKKPVGTVWIAVAKQGKAEDARSFYFQGSRQTIIECSANTALGMLLQHSEDAKRMSE